MPARTRREDLVALLQDYAGEAELLGQEFAGRHRLHPTDLHALLAVMRADSAGEPLTPGVLDLLRVDVHPARDDHACPDAT